MYLLKGDVEDEKRTHAYEGGGGLKFVFFAHVHHVNRPFKITNCLQSGCFSIFIDKMNLRLIVSITELRLQLNKKGHRHY